MSVRPIARERRHTLYFLEETRQVAAVHLDTEVDMSRVLEHRAAARRDGAGYSVVTYVMHAAARVLARHPAANAAVRGRRRLRIAHYAAVDVKITLDKTVAGQRVVVSAVLPGLDGADLARIQASVDRYARGDPAVMPEFAGVRLLHRLPAPVGRRLFRRVVRPLGRRPRRLGTLAVTSLGHRRVDGFHSVGGTTVTLGLGRIAERPVVRDGAVVPAPVMRLNLSFDHRVIDGAEAADILDEIAARLEDGALADAPEDAAAAAASPRDGRPGGPSAGATVAPVTSGPPPTAETPHGHGGRR